MLPEDWRKPMAWYGIALICVAGAAALYVLLCFIVVNKMEQLYMHPSGAKKRTFDQVREEQTALGAVDYAVYDSLEKDRFTLHCDGANIACEYIPVPFPPGERRKCLIRVHGFTQNRLISWRWLPAFRALGYAAVIYDQRCFGASTGDACTLGFREKQDLAQVITWVKEHLGEDAIIGIHGESMGAITALEALGIDGRIDFIVEDGGASTMEAMFRYVLRQSAHLPAFPTMALVNRMLKRRYGFTLDELRPLDRVAASPVPILFIHGTADRDVPPEECPKLFAASKNPLSRMELFEGADHCHGHALDPERYEKVMQDFVLEVEKTL
jgi:pimeloyl-ACP methyl ester carboxylesterase